uniref:ATP-binding cassette sub-family C member 4 n=1 Tax=Lepeophtheirus salmonis TaxID=72036 RepID=A0A0K2T7J4_LEPSM
MDFQQEYFQETNPKSKTNILSNILFLWTIPFIRKGQKEDFDVHDLYKTLREDYSRELNDRLEKEWQKELSKVKTFSGNYHPSFAKAAIRTFRLQTLLSGVFVLFEECVLRIAQPFAIFKIIGYFSSGGTVMSEDELYFWSGILVGAGVIFVLFDQRYWYLSLKTGMQLRIAASAIIYRKALTLSKASLGRSSIGQMVNLLSNDVNRFDNSTVFLQYLWVAPIQFICVMLITSYFAGIEAVAGGALLIFFIFFQTYMGKMFSKLRLMTASKTDIRIQIMNEILDGIKVIKMYAWETPFVQLVTNARKNEMSVIKQTAGCKSFNYAFFSTSSRFVLLPVFLLMVLFGVEINAQKIFLIFGLFDAIKLPLTHFFPSAISASSEALVSMKRIEEFLLLNELRDVQSKINHVILPGRYEPLTVEVTKISGKWLDSSNEFTLKNISFSVEIGELCAIIGPVGCGKSTIIQSLLGEFPVSYGEINIKGRISYASQEAWIFSGSVRQNILMGKPLIDKRYREVIRVCALEHDVREWPDGDYTFVGEKGISLSGGQKSRINLARCVYASADIYILDDPLSAVDPHVGQQLFDTCIQKFLSDKTVILVTHQLQFLKNANNIILLNSDGEIEASGTYEKLMSQSGFVTYLEATSEEEDSDLLSDVLSDVKSDGEYMRSQKKKLKKGVRSRRSSTSLLVPVPYIGGSTERDTFPEEKGSQEWKMGSKETIIEGSVSLSLYHKYFVAGGGFFKFLCVYFLSLITHTLFVVSDWWLRLWTNAADARKLGPLPPTFYFSEYQDMTLQITADFQVDFFNFIYCSIYLSLIIILLFSAQLSVRQLFMSCMRSSQTLHDRMFEKVAFTNSRFFDLNPNGRILNRFSKDIGSIDELLPPVLIDTNWVMSKEYFCIPLYIICFSYSCRPFSLDRVFLFLYL